MHEIPTIRSIVWKGLRVSNPPPPTIPYFVNWNSLHARLNSHYKAWSYKKKKYKKIKANLKHPYFSPIKASVSDVNFSNNSGQGQHESSECSDYRKMLIWNTTLFHKSTQKKVCSPMKFLFWEKVSLPYFRERDIMSYNSRKSCSRRPIFLIFNLFIEVLKTPTNIDQPKA